LEKNKIKKLHKPMSTSRKTILAVAIFLAIIIGAEILRYLDPLVEEKIVTIDQPHLERLKDFALTNAELHLTLSESKDLILQGTLESSQIYIWGPWNSHLYFTNCTITKSSIHIENIAVYAQNCSIIDSTFDTTLTSECCVLIKGNHFSGSDTFNINVVDQGGNIGLENVVFGQNVTTSP